jgi:hypothetical protein
MSSKLCCDRWQRCSHALKLRWRWGWEVCRGWTSRRAKQRYISWPICADISSRGLNSGTKRTWTAFCRMWVAIALRMWHYAPPPRHILLNSFHTSTISLLATDWTARIRIPAVQGFSFLHSVQTGSAAHPDSYPMGMWGSFIGGKAAGAWSWPLTSI